MGKNPKPLLWQNPLVKRPDFVNAFGMMSIEIAEMERHLARLLGRLLNATPEIAEALYFTPKAAIPRIEFLENVAPITLANNEKKRTAIEKLATRAKALMGKRHDLVHNQFSLEGTQVVTFRYKDGERQSRPVDLEEIERLVEDIRRLNIDLVDLAEYGSTEDWLSTSP